MKTVFKFLATRIPEISAFIASLVFYYQLGMSVWTWLILWISLDLMTASKDQTAKVSK